MVLGSVHAFSVFLVPLEAQFGATRSQVSLTYSLALVAITASVLLGYKVFARWPAGSFVMGICALAAAGALVAALAPSLIWVWVGYSLLFGTANGLGYGFGLQLSAQANPARPGMAMGIVTACYALGATLSPAVFAAALASGGTPTAFVGLAATLAAAALICGMLLSLSGAFFAPAASVSARKLVPRGQFTLLWFGYGAGVAGGLMAIGHAAGIASSMGFTAGPWITPTLIAFCNMIGSLAGGWLADRVNTSRLLIGLPMVTAIALSLMVFHDHAVTSILCLGLVGFAYGAIIAAYPASIARRFGPQDSPRIYGQVFIAWGLAGLTAPWFAGALYDQSGSYSAALMTAGVISLGSAVAVALYAVKRNAQG
jgi:predicted MFS family arabinose efflux permease